MHFVGDIDLSLLDLDLYIYSVNVMFIFSPYTVRGV